MRFKAVGEPIKSTSDGMPQVSWQQWSSTPELTGSQLFPMILNPNREVDED